MSSENIDWQRLVEAVGERRGTDPAQKETTIDWTKAGELPAASQRFDQDVARIQTEEAGIARRLLQHPLFTPSYLEVDSGNRRPQQVKPEYYTRGRITAVNGYIPIGIVKIQATKRKSSGHYKVVSPCRGSAESDDTRPGSKYNQREIPQPENPLNW